MTCDTRSEYSKVSISLCIYTLIVFFSKLSNDILCIWNKNISLNDNLLWETTAKYIANAVLAHWAVGDVGVILKVLSPNTSYRLSSWVLLGLVKLLSAEYQRTHCWRIKVDSTNGLVSPGIRPLPETLLMGIYARPQWVNMYATAWKIMNCFDFFIPLTTCLDSRVY